MTLGVLRTDLGARAEREWTFWDYIKRMPKEDRKLFFSLARNRPGPGGSISDPERHGFVRISAVRDDASALRDLVAAAPRVERDDSPTRTFQRAVELVHRVAPNFAVYVGRTYVRAGAEHSGPRQRWVDHHANKRMQYATVLAQVRNGQVERYEHLAIALVLCWRDYGALCCNNNVLSGRQGKGPDAWQLIYLCLRPR